jgi:hypothetical protein
MRPPASALVLLLVTLGPGCGDSPAPTVVPVVLNAPVQTASLQEWAVRYELRP